MPENEEPKDFEDIDERDPETGRRSRFGWQSNDAVVFRDNAGNRISGKEWKEMIRREAADRGEDAPRRPHPFSGS